MPREPPVIKATRPSNDNVGSDGIAKKSYHTAGVTGYRMPGVSSTWIQIRVGSGIKAPLKDCPTMADSSNNAA
jgi:hypothetical protein